MSRTPAVELAGYLGAAVGVGEAARLYVAALRSAGVAVRERDVVLPGRDRVNGVSVRGPSHRAVGANLLCLNPEQMIPYLEGEHAPPMTGRANVGIWSWEVDVLPPGWREAASRLTEVWTYSRFAADLIESGIGVPVVNVPLPVLVGRAGGESSINLPPGFRVLVMFDYLSTLERKNPLGAIAAFCKAFGPDDGAILLLKSVNAQHRPERAQELSAATAGRADIITIDQTMSPGERDALISSCDCYLSLHRSEGYGLPLAEAMAAETTVLATAYGGNMEFMTARNSYLVDWSPATVGEGVEHYPAAATWAEPNVEQAAMLLRELHDDPQQARARALRARSDVLRMLAPDVVGDCMRRRLESLERRLWSLKRIVPRLPACRGWGA